MPGTDETGSEQFGNRVTDKGKMKLKAFGAELEITGTQLIKSIFSSAVAILLCVGLYIHDKNTVSAIAEMTQAQAGMIYMIKLSVPEREALHLDKPDIIRNMERRNKDRNGD